MEGSSELKYSDMAGQPQASGFLVVGKPGKRSEGLTKGKSDRNGSESKDLLHSLQLERRSR